MEGTSDIARGIHTSQPGDLVFSQMMEELGATASPIRRLELLAPKAESRVAREDIRRAVKLLRKAAFASRHRNWTRSYAMVRLALEAVGRDKQLLRELMKTHGLTFIIMPRRLVARDRRGLVDARLTTVSNRPPRLGFAPR